MLRTICLRLALVCLALIFFTMPAHAKTILYVPMDDRPVNYNYPADTVTAAGIQIIMPPAEFVGGRGREGLPDKVWEWTLDNASRADALVLSADALLYGGLVDSRTHGHGKYSLEWRAMGFEMLKKARPDTPIYLFSTVMRSPVASGGFLEPYYYRQYGNDIYKYMALQEKLELEGLSAEESKHQKQLLKKIQPEVIGDWLDRREKNLKNNLKFVDLARNKTLEYFLLGRDDTSYYSRSHKETRVIKEAAKDLTTDSFCTFPGADQLGMIMLARAYNNLNNNTPLVYVYYAPGQGDATVPRYEDQKFGTTVTDHIIVAGGQLTTNQDKATMELAVNTPLIPITEEAEVVENYPIVTDYTRQFVSRIETAVKKGKIIAVADVAYANGADNSLMEELSQSNMLDKLSSYSGWNTASNTLGYAIGQGMMSATMPTKERQKLLIVRYIDDWAYQANIRPRVYYALDSSQASTLRYLSTPTPDSEQLTKDEVRKFAAQYLWIPLDDIQVSFPWSRLFEIEVKVKKNNN